MTSRFLAGIASHNTHQNVTFTPRQPMAANKVRPDPTHFSISSIRRRIDRYQIVYALSVRCEELQYLRGGAWRAKQIALHFRAAEQPNLLQLLLRLYPFGGDPQFETSSKIGDGTDNSVRFIFVRQRSNKAPVDLDLMERKTQQ